MASQIMVDNLVEIYQDKNTVAKASPTAEEKQP
jgi:hypothetical protein